MSVLRSRPMPAEDIGMNFGFILKMLTLDLIVLRMIIGKILRMIIGKF